jgi:amino-acid N-acetyltransferase
MTLALIAARPDDFEAIVQLLRDNQLPIDGLRDHLATTLLARDQDAIVGSAALEVYEDGALLRSVAVSRDRRNSGLGRMLTEAAIALARTHRVPALYLLTDTAEQYFPRFGFERIARGDVPAGVQRSVEFTSVCPVSAIVMRKSL